MFGTQNDANIHRISRKHKSTFKHLEHIRKTIACVQNSLTFMKSHARINKQGQIQIFQLILKGELTFCSQK